jgi:hypothetical protein
VNDPNGKGARQRYAPPSLPVLGPVLDRNIETLRQRRLREERSASWRDRMADAIAHFAGSILFVCIHFVVLVFWITANLGWILGIPVWDESFVLLAAFYLFLDSAMQERVAVRVGGAPIKFESYRSTPAGWKALKGR